MRHRVIGSLLAAAIVFAGEQAEAQQHPIFTQYMFNGLIINPAYAGTHESTTLTASIRNQWTGINGSPQTQVLTGHAPIGFTRSAAGGMFVHDKVGVTNHYMVYGTYAYHIPVSAKAQISVGAQAGFTYYKADYTQLGIISGDGLPDPSFSAIESRFLPNIGIGAYYYSEKAYVGLSIPEVVSNPWSKLDPSLQSRQERHYFLSAGYVFTLNQDLKLKPNTLLKWMEGGPFQFDLNANLYIKQIGAIGVSYRMQDSVDGIIQYNINDQFSLGYSYGYPVNSLAALQSGTHEVVINYRLKKDKHIVLSPRYF